MTKRAVRILVLTVLAIGFASVGGALATEESDTTVTPTDSTETEPGEDSTTDRLLAEGRVVYEANCVGCHQTDGAGVSGVFPPLVNNENVLDAGYVSEVILQGRDGEITVSGVTYNGAMPAFSALSEDQVTSLTLYVQEGLGEPEPAAPPAPTGTSPVSPGLPLSTILAYTAGFGIFALGIGVVAGPIALARRSRGTFSDVEVWLKAIAIFAYFVLATVFIPSLVVESSFLASPPDVYKDLFSGDSWGLIRDLIASGVWLGALLLGFWALRRAQREDVI